MLDIPLNQFPWEIELTANIEFQSLGEFNNAVLGLVDEERKKYRTTSDELEARGLLTHLEAVQSFPKLTLHLDDYREEKVTTIPKPSNLPPRVEWSYLPY